MNSLKKKPLCYFPANPHKSVTNIIFIRSEDNSYFRYLKITESINPTKILI